ncbi:hypothetical protein NPS01_30580 [Nocardioides psychrotolerans]|uniref:Glycosyl hydrolase family 26 n=1 Tax=Nocardioides psychrotolerans TaxID=1005945 RepID=A0A1I3NQ66_9ACTN|nr:hypothetical protein NPS01_30580 [Nocardioides psychrotolerans]SFJ10906.1 Glycosyl hydrolase family 26 [Nocardioides psychrotolerans]
MLAVLLGGGSVALLTGSDGDDQPSASTSPSGTPLPSPSPTPEPTPEPTSPAPTPSTTVTPTPDCTPDVPLVDADATPEARCLAQALDGWQRDGLMGVGQQLNLSNEAYQAPLRQLGGRSVALVGFDLQELEEGEGFGFYEPPVQRLLQLAADGVVLTASWHTPNPDSGLDARDRRWTDLAALLQPETPQAVAFWADYDAKLELLGRLQSGDDGLLQPAAVLFRPLHEANGDWFWWGQPDPETYRALWAAMQERAADAGVHNIVWGWSANVASHDGITDPLTLVPDSVDLVGIDSYDPVGDGSGQADPLDLNGLADLAADHPRTAVTEVGPHGSTDGDWDPTVIARSALAVGVRPTYALLWFDDGDGADGYTGAKQISSLRGGRDWLDSCTDGLCPLS